VLIHLAHTLATKPGIDDITVYRAECISESDGYEMGHFLFYVLLQPAGNILFLVILLRYVYFFPCWK
jgi:hypothetical protein